MTINKIRLALFAANALLSVAAIPALADSEGTYSPSTFAAQVQGPMVDAGVGRSFVYNTGEGGQQQGLPVISTPSASRQSRVAGSFQFNSGQNG